jgi:hypothetical protein
MQYTAIHGVSAGGDIPLKSGQAGAQCEHSVSSTIEEKRTTTTPQPLLDKASDILFREDNILSIV